MPTASCLLFNGTRSAPRNSTRLRQSRDCRGKRLPATLPARGEVLTFGRKNATIVRLRTRLRSTVADHRNRTREKSRTGRASGRQNHGEVTHEEEAEQAFRPGCVARGSGRDAGPPTHSQCRRDDGKRLV